MNTAKKTVANTHKTLLAGAGVYDSTREKAADTFDCLFVSGSELVNELLEKGEAVEAELYAKLEGRKMFKEKFSRLKAKLGFGHTASDQQLEMLNKRVDSLIDVVAKLAQQQAAEQKAPAKPSVKAKATKTTAKTAVKPASKAKSDKTPAVAKPAAKAKATKTPAKSATKPASKAKTAKTTAKAAAKPASKTADKPTAKVAAKPASKKSDKPTAKATATAKSVDNNTTAKADSNASAKD